MASSTVTKRDLRKAFTQFKNGRATKTQLEQQLYGNTNARGKRITRDFANVLGLDTRGGQVVDLNA